MKSVRNCLSVSGRSGGGAAREKRAALARPGVLLAAMAVTVGGGIMWAGAKTGTRPVKMTVAPQSAKQKVHKPADLDDLPALMRSYGQRRANWMASAQRSAHGGALPGPGLVEADLTAHTKSDEREPVYSANGDLIAFSSNGVDANGDGKLDDAINAENKYHIWVMDRVTNLVYQVTGLYTDKNRNQRGPTWSDDGNIIAYVDSSILGEDGKTYPQISLVRPRTDADNTLDGIQPAPPQIITNLFPGNKLAPAWSPTGQEIAFACDANLDGDATDTRNDYDIFTVLPNGDSDSIRRVTGGTNDTVGRLTSDLNPAYSTENENAIYFSSNRDNNGRLTKGRRIWAVSATGTGMTVITDPTVREAGTVDDIDDNPSLSTGGGQELLAFQTNSRVDSSDTSADGADNNIWTLPVDSTTIIPPAVEDPENNPFLVTSIFASNVVERHELVTDVAANALVPQYKDTLPNVFSGPEGVDVANGYIYVANRGAGYIERYFANTGLPAPPPNRFGSRFTYGGNLKAPAGIKVVNGYIYIAGGAGTTTAPNKTAVYRYSATTGLGAGTVGTATDGVFSAGETDTNGGTITNGCESVAIGPDITRDGVPEVFVTVVSNNKVNVYDGADGGFVGVWTSLVAGTNDIRTPTGLAFGPDLDGDGFQDLYVCSSFSSKIFVYSGDPNNFPVVTQTAPLTTIGDSTNGVAAPEGIVFKNLDGPSEPNNEMYISCYNGGLGRNILRFDYDPATKTFSPAPNTAIAAAPSAIWYQTNASGVGYFDFDDAVAIGPQIPPDPTAEPNDPVESAFTSATVLTNYISSPDRFAASALSGTTAAEDKASDIEPAFSRVNLSIKLLSTLVFSSGRRYAPSPASDTSDPSPLEYNEYGGNELKTDGTAASPTPTNDLWSTVARDTTPPVLVPQGTGNLRAPFIAPSPNAGFSYAAPRTLEAGLLPDSPIKIAFVLEEKQSGIATSVASKAVTVSFKNADARLYVGDNINTNTTVITKPNDSLRVRVTPEVAPIRLTKYSSMPVAVYDDGPPSVGGHERQASAVAGDGVYYCESTVPQDADPLKARIKTPVDAGDYYIDVDVTDVAGNSFTFDNIWGFSTRKFAANGTSAKRDLFVSDYTVGQAFRATLNDDGDIDSRYADMPPVEGYWLTNPGGQLLNDDNTIAASSIPATFSEDSVDVWRTLCRGALSQTDIAPYRPSSTPAIDPNPDAAANNIDGVEPFTEKPLKLTVTKTCIIWAAPYAGTVFAGPGTIVDTTQQALLTEYLEAGGRLFLSGRDILWNANGSGEIGNSFFSDKVRAAFGGEAHSTSLTSEAGSFDDGVPGMDRIEFPQTTDPNNTYWDASLTQAAPPVNTNQATEFDLIAPSGNSTGVTPAYSYNGTPVGQRVAEQYADGSESRIVFFAFNFDAVNRGYDTTWGCYNRRFEIASLIRQYFKTVTIKGTVRDNAGSANGKTIPNFLVKAVGGGKTYMARTDESGQYTFDGLPEGSYTISPYNALKEATPRIVDPNRFYFDGTPVTYGVPGGATIVADDITVTKYPEGSLRANVVESHATPDDLTDDQPLPNIQVLVRSKEKSAAFTGGGYYAQLGRTVNSTGSNPVAYFQMSNLPPGIQYEVIFNPKLEDIPIESQLRDAFTKAGGQNPNYGRRIIPDKKRPEAITVAASTIFQLNDVASGDSTGDEGFPIVVPLGPSVSGIVTARGVPVAGATVTPFRSGGGTVPKPVTTDENGAYTFGDVKPGTYTFKVTATIDGLIFSTTKTGIVVTQGTDIVSPSAADIELPIAQITGTVVNGKGAIVPNATVVLQTSTGVTYSPSRTATTNANGKFKLSPLVKGTYNVFASSGSLSGSVPATVDVSTDGSGDANVTVTITRTGIYGQVFLNGAVKSGLQVELLKSTGDSYSPQRLSTTDVNGFYTFTDVILGADYKVKASFKGDTVIVDVSYDTNPTKAPDINLRLAKLYGRVVNSDGSAAANARVTLLQDGAELRSVNTDASGNYAFGGTSAGTYSVRATLGAAVGQRNKITMPRGQATQVPDIILQVGASAGNPTVFSNTSRSYIISFPYETSNSPATNNKYVTGEAAASIRVKDAFDLLPVDATSGVRNYTLERLNTTSGLYEKLDGANDLIERGRGYRLKVSRGPISMKLGATPLESSQTFFRITLGRNPSLTSNPNNGLNLIGFGLNPKTFSKVSWENARVISPKGVIYESPAAAAQAGLIDAGLFTLDPSGSTESTIYVKKMGAFGGYYARTYVNGVTIVLRNPEK